MTPELLLGLDLAVAILGLPLVFLCGYLFLLALLARPSPVPPAPNPPRLRFDVIVPAHNEEVGIARTVQNLRAVDYPTELVRVVVVADNCTDQTAARAAGAGAVVLERLDGEKRGKGYALEYAFARSLEEGMADAVVVVDADTEVSPNLLTAFAARLAHGAEACQAEYGVLNPDASWRTRLITIALALFHNLRSYARERMGVSCGLRGNGMCFSRRVIREVPHQAFSIVEDLEYGLRLGQAGHRVHYAGEAWVKGEMVTSGRAAESQRRRWEGGRWTMMQLHGWPLFKKAVRTNDNLLLDLALDVLVPPLSTVVSLSVVGLCAGGALRFAGAPGAALGAFGACLLFLTVYVLRGWAISGVGIKGLVALGYAPFYVAWKLVLLLTRPRQKRGEWVRTAREAERPGPSP